MREQRTISLPRCVGDHPPRSTWPDKNLIRGICPSCGWHEGDDGRKSARMLRARALMRKLVGAREGPRRG